MKSVKSDPFSRPGTLTWCFGVSSQPLDNGHDTDGKVIDGNSYSSEKEEEIVDGNNYSSGKRGGLVTVLHFSE